MSFDDDTFNKALRVFQEFGPLRRLPRAQRLSEEFPSLSGREICDLIERFKKIEEAVYAFAEEARDGQISDAAGKAKLKAECPMLSDELVSTTFGQAMYFVHK